MKVAVITPTIGTDYLETNLKSVASQTYEKVIHVVVADGPKYHKQVDKQINKIKNDKRIVINLPQNTGHSQYNGHRIYGSIPYLIEADYIIFLDEDNWIDPNHVEELTKVAKNTDWAFSFRKIIDENDKFICYDDCESLGRWPTCLSDKEYFVDVGCYFLPKALAIQLSPAWYRRARHPKEQPEVDRLLMAILKQNKYTHNTSYQYSLNYRVGNRDDSVKSDFFINGNQMMEKKYNGKLPWKIKDQ